MSKLTVEKFLLHHVQNYICSHTSPDLEPFKNDLLNWGKSVSTVTPKQHAAVSILQQSLAHCSEETRQLMQLFDQNCNQLHWEQTYNISDNVVSDSMLNGYAFAELIGLNGPFVSDRIRCGIGIWGPYIDYPAHYHQSSEVYIVLSGSARFTISDNPTQRCHANDTIAVTSMQIHEFHTTDLPLVVLYLWRNGNLREKSTFVKRSTTI